MAVAFDAASESHTGTSASQNETSFSWVHAPAGTPRGVLVFTFANANADLVSGVTYGGVAMVAVSGGEAADTAGEPARCKAWFLGASIPTGSQTVVVSRTNNVNVLYAGCITVTAAADTEIAGTPVLLQENQTLAEQNVDTGVTTAQRFAGLHTGLGTLPSVGANTTHLHSIQPSVTSLGYMTARETTPGSGSRPVGWSSGFNDDVAAVHLAIAESGGGGPPPAGERSSASIIG